MEKNIIITDIRLIAHRAHKTPRVLSIAHLCKNAPNIGNDSIVAKTVNRLNIAYERGIKQMQPKVNKTFITT